MARTKLGDMRILFVFEDGSREEWHAPKDKVQDKHRAALRAAYDAWVTGIYPNLTEKPASALFSETPDGR